MTQKVIVTISDKEPIQTKPTNNYDTFATCQGHECPKHTPSKIVCHEKDSNGGTLCGLPGNHLNDDIEEKYEICLDCMMTEIESEGKVLSNGGIINANDMLPMSCTMFINERDGKGICVRTYDCTSPEETDKGVEVIGVWKDSALRHFLEECSEGEDKTDMSRQHYIVQFYNERGIPTRHVNPTPTNDLRHKMTRAIRIMKKDVVNYGSAREQLEREAYLTGLQRVTVREINLNLRCTIDTKVAKYVEPS